MIHEILPVGPLRCNCSILGDEASREAMVVDPGDDISRILTLLAKHQLTVKQIVVTHAHIDHIAGAARLKALTGAPILYNQLDLPMVDIMDLQADWLGISTPEVPAPDHSPADNSLIRIGHHLGLPRGSFPEPSPTGLSATVLYTPGHTPGSLCLHLPDYNLLLAGDTLFAGSVGRTDLPGGNTRQLLNSIHSRLLPLPDTTRVLPGHGPATTIGEERQSNPFLRNL